MENPDPLRFIVVPVCRGTTANNTRPRCEVNSPAITIPAAGLLTAACARHYSAELETADALYFAFPLRDGSNFSFVYQNTAGALKEGIGRNYEGTPEDGQRIVDLLEALAPTDVQLGTAATGNFDNNGLRDLIMYQAAIQPKIYIPNHITTGTRAREGSSLSVYAGFLNQMYLMDVPAEDRPRLHWLVDPVDYIKPIVFDVDQAAWADPGKQSALDGYCSPTGVAEPTPVSLN